MARRRPGRRSVRAGVSLLLWAACVYTACVCAGIQPRSSVHIHIRLIMSGLVI